MFHDAVFFFAFYLQVQKMGSEQSQQARAAAEAQNRTNNLSRLQRGHTIAITGRRLSSPNDEAAPANALSDSRPVSPPISVCSDSDLPYVSYTDKLGGEFSLNTFICLNRFEFNFHMRKNTNIPFFIDALTILSPIADSPKRQNKASTSSNKNIRNMSSTKRTILSKTKAKSVAHDIVVVREANKKNGIEIDPDIQRLQVIEIGNLTS